MAHTRQLLSALVLGLVLTVPAGGQLPTGGTPILPADTVASAELIAGAGMAQRSVVAVTGQSFNQAVRIEVLQRPANVFNMLLVIRTSAAVARGDIISVTASIRKAGGASEYGRSFLVFEKSSDPFTRSVTRELVDSSGEWQHFIVTFAAAEDHPAGEAWIDFQLGFDPQIVEIGGVSAVNYAKTRTLESLPNNYTYAGRQSNASWRAPAAARIEQLRKGNIQVQVRNGTEPVANASVGIRMKRHAFHFGTAVDASILFEGSAEGQKYRETLEQQFNSAVLENAAKWPEWEHNRNLALQAFAWLRDHGFERVRGHNFIWPSFRWMPADVKTTYDATLAARGQTAANDELRARILNHITEEATAVRGLVTEWDAVNEPIHEDEVIDILGQAEVKQWFDTARLADPQARLYINEFDILNDTDTIGAYESLIGTLRSSGAPLGGIGFQGHFLNGLTSIDRMHEIVNRFAALGLPIHITEHDVDVPGESDQADFFRDFLTLMFSHPSVDGITQWGFWEGRHWRPRAALYRRDWTIKPNGQIYNDLVFNQWWTDVDGTTSGAGSFSTRGFLGDYEITVRSGGNTVTRNLSLTAAGGTLIIDLQEPSRRRPARR